MAGKKYKKVAATVNREQKFDVKSAIDLAIKASFAKFDESVDMALNLGIDPKQTDQAVRSTVSLPHGTGKTTRVVVFAKGEKAKEAEAAGAESVGADDLVEKILGGWLDFDKAIATPDMMGTVAKVAKVLGPRGMMPNPKLGTVTQNVAQTVKELKMGRTEFRAEKGGIVHCGIGRRSFGVDKLYDNAVALISAVVKAKPATSKGTYLLKAAVSTTMGVGVKIDPLDASRQVVS